MQVLERLGDDLVFSHVLRWALLGVIWGFIGERKTVETGPGLHELRVQTGTLDRDEVIAELRFTLLVAVAQAVKDSRLGKVLVDGPSLDLDQPPEGFPIRKSLWNGHCPELGKSWDILSCRGSKPHWNGSLFLWFGAASGVQHGG